jgi:hypothetical protein
MKNLDNIEDAGLGPYGSCKIVNSYRPNNIWHVVIELTFMLQLTAVK